jgi:hypothetical protein
MTVSRNVRIGLGEGQRYVPVTYVGGAKAASDLDLVTLVYPRGRST